MRWCLARAAARPIRPIPTPPCRRARVGTSSARRAAQLLHARPDLRITLMRGNVATRLEKLDRGEAEATLLALAGLRRLGLEHRADLVLDPEAMVPAAGRGIVGVTVRAADTELHELLAAIEDPEARAVSRAERALLAALDGSCRTPIGGHGRLLPDGAATSDGPRRPRRRRLPAQAQHHRGGDGRRSACGQELGRALRADSPADIFAA